jgi:hypothetical protein
MVRSVSRTSHRAATPAAVTAEERLASFTRIFQNNRRTIETGLLRSSHNVARQTRRGRWGGLTAHVQTAENGGYHGTTP